MTKKLLVVMTAIAALTLLATASFADSTGKTCDKKCCQSKAAAATDPAAKQGTAVDPVCKMDVTVEGGKYTAEYQGKTYYFCSKSCMKMFKKDPAKYIKEKADKTEKTK